MSAKARISRLRKSENLQKHTLIACILATISQATIIVLLGESKLNVLNMQTAPTYEAYIAELAAWTSDNFDAFWSHMIPDVLHPFFYSAAIMFTLTWALEKSQFSDKWDVLPLVPWLAGLLVSGFLGFLVTWSFPPDHTLGSEAPFAHFRTPRPPQVACRIS